MPYIGDEYIPRGRGRRGASGEALLGGGRRGGAGSWQQYRGGGQRPVAPRFNPRADDTGRSDLITEMGDLVPTKTTGNSLETQPVDKSLADVLRTGVDYTEADKLDAQADAEIADYEKSGFKRFIDRGDYAQRVEYRVNNLRAQAAERRRRAQEKFGLDIKAKQLDAAGPAEPKRRQAYDETTGRQKWQIQDSKGGWVDEMLFERTPSEGGEHYLLSKFYAGPGERDKTNEQIREVKERGAEERKTIGAQGAESRKTISHQGAVWGGGKAGATGGRPKDKADFIIKYIKEQNDKYTKMGSDGKLYRADGAPTDEEIFADAVAKADVAYGGTPAAATPAPEKPRALGPASSPSPSPTPSATPSAGRGVPTPSPTPPPAAARPSVTPTPAPRPRYEKIINDKGEAKIWDNVEKKIVGDVR